MQQQQQQQQQQQGKPHDQLKLWQKEYEEHQRKLQERKQMNRAGQGIGNAVGHSGRPAAVNAQNAIALKELGQQLWPHVSSINAKAIARPRPDARNMNEGKAVNADLAALFSAAPAVNPSNQVAVKPDRPDIPADWISFKLPPDWEQFNDSDTVLPWQTAGTVNHRVGAQRSDFGPDMNPTGPSKTPAKDGNNCLKTPEKGGPDAPNPSNLLHPTGSQKKMANLLLSASEELDKLRN